MIQGAINQLLAIGAAAKKAGDIADAKAARAEKAAVKEQQARDRAMQRMQQKVQAKWDQNKEYQRFKETLGKNNQAPEALKRIAFEAYKSQPEVRVGKDKIDITSLGPDAQEAIRRSK